MLRSLDIRDMIIIDRMSLDFRPGLNVLTGETGAGKSILLDCLGFVLGWRGRSDLLRKGAESGEVTAAFDLHPRHSAMQILESAGIAGGQELVLRRVVGADGRKTAWVNDRRVSADILRDLSDRLVELHGQHDDHGLLNPRSHRVMLDAYGAIDLSAVRTAWAARGDAQRRLEIAQSDAATLRAEDDYLRHAASELDRLAPRMGEEAELDSRRRLMQANARLRDDVVKAIEALGPDGAEGRLRDAARWLERVADKSEGRLDEAMEALMRAITAVGEAQDGTERALEDMMFDPADLERVEERLFALRALGRKHAVAPDELAELAATIHLRLEALDGAEVNLKALAAVVEVTESTYVQAADQVRAGRLAAAQRLDQAIAAELAPLKLDKATFETTVLPAEAGPDGTDTVEFAVSTSPGGTKGPLSRIASGGELSRFLLALKVCLAQRDDTATMIFDEIDRGVGGATADAVGRRLATLARGRQILAVTHSPQVAARADTHWRVEKRIEGNVSRSEVRTLNEGERIAEIARMLAGETVTEAAMAAARALMSA